jgi:mannonate dehydratase
MLPHAEDDRMDSTQASGKAHSEGTGYALRAISGYHASRPGIQIATQMSAAASEEDMRFAQQLGIEWVMTSLDKPEEHTAESYLRLRRKFEAFGLRIYRLANHACHNMEEVTLNLPGRDEKVAQYLDYIRNLGKAGIHYSTYAHMGNGIWSTGRATMRGGVEARAFDLAKAKAGYWNGRVFEGPLTHGRVYTEEELWENYAYFIKKVVPVAEEAGVFIGVHPDDPPVYPLGGIPRCIFGTFAGYKRALEIANSPNIGVCLCIGCWLEGGQGMGADVIEAIRYFGARGKLFKAHFRNVSRPMPAPWAETFMDDGYMNMHQVVKALREVRFDGAIISDHLPSMIGGRRAAEAYSVAYMRALVQAADDECTGA